MMQCVAITSVCFKTELYVDNVNLWIWNNVF